MPDVISLLIDGKLYEGWKSSSVSQAMDAAAGTFNLVVIDRWTPGQEPWVPMPGSPCEVRVAGETLITGYVDLVRPQFGPDQHSLQVQGRDKSGDMVDCSAVHRPDQWKSIGLLEFANIIAKPFGITVKADTDLGAPLTQVKLQQGETALEAIHRHAQMRKVLVMPDGKGGLLLTRTGKRRASVPLVQGRNVKDGSGTLDWSERHSKYIVKGQSGYSASTSGAAESHASAEVEDKEITRYRPLLLVNGGETNNATAKERATWEANTRVGKSTSATLTVVGWRESEGGPLWQPNTLVQVDVPALQIKGEMLIRQVTYSRDEGGTLAKVDIVSPQAYAPEPPGSLKSKKRKKGGKGKGISSWGAALADDADDGDD